MKAASRFLFAVSLTMSTPLPAAVKPSAAPSANSFAFSCLDQIKSQPGNLAISPFSLWAALTMTSGGASGATRAEMAKALNLPDDEAAHALAGGWMDDLNSTKGIELRIASRLWPSTKLPVAPTFLALTEKRYHGGLEALDYVKDANGARKRINAWVEKQTNDRIRDLLKPGNVDAGTKMVLTNAIYFKAKWQTEFNSQSTRPWKFTRASGKEMEAPFMFLKNAFPYYENDALQAVKLPYRGGDTSMLIVLPKKGHGTDEAGLINAKTYTTLRSGLEEAKVVVRLPRFEVSQRLEAVPLLQSLGMKTAFTDSADFSRLCATEPLKLSNVIHQAWVKVGEEGTEAAAATAIAARAGARPNEEVVKLFVADHPFLFFIVDDRNGGILFLGRVDEPSAK